MALSDVIQKLNDVQGLNKEGKIDQSILDQYNNKNKTSITNENLGTLSDDDIIRYATTLARNSLGSGEITDDQLANEIDKQLAEMGSNGEYKNLRLKRLGLVDENNPQQIVYGDGGFQVDPTITNTDFLTDPNNTNRKSAVSGPQQISNVYRGLLNGIGGAIDTVYDNSLGLAIDGLLDKTGIAKDINTRDTFDGSDIGTGLDLARMIGLSFIPGWGWAANAGLSAISEAGNIGGAISGIDQVTGEKLENPERGQLAGGALLDIGLSALPGGVGNAAKAGGKITKAKEIAPELAEKYGGAEGKAAIEELFEPVSGIKGKTNYIADTEKGNALSKQIARANDNPNKYLTEEQALERLGNPEARFSTELSPKQLAREKELKNALSKEEQALENAQNKSFEAASREDDILNASNPDYKKTSKLHQQQVKDMRKQADETETELQERFNVAKENLDDFYTFNKTDQAQFEQLQKELNDLKQAGGDAEKIAKKEEGLKKFLEQNNIAKPGDLVNAPDEVKNLVIGQLLRAVDNPAELERVMAGMFGKESKYSAKAVDPSKLNRKGDLKLSEQGSNTIKNILQGKGSKGMNLAGRVAANTAADVVGQENGLQDIVSDPGEWAKIALASLLPGGNKIKSRLGRNITNVSYTPLTAAALAGQQPDKYTNVPKTNENGQIVTEDLIRQYIQNRINDTNKVLGNE